MDEMDAIKRYVNMILPVEIDSGIVVSVDQSSALISIKSGSPFSAQIGDVTRLSQGDSVVIMRPRGIQTWTIVSVLNSKQRGVATQASPKANRAPGGKEWSPVTVNNPNATKNMATGSVIMPLVAITKVFGGGSALVAFTASCNVTTNGGTFDIQLVVDQVPITIFTLQQATGVRLAVPFTYVHPLPLEGSHFFRVQAVSPSSAATFVITSFSVSEI